MLPAHPVQLACCPALITHQFSNSPARSGLSQTIDQLIRKAGFTSTAVTVRSSLRVTRYQSTTCSLTYDEYCKLKDREHAGSKVLLHKQQLVTVSAAQ